MVRTFLAKHHRSPSEPHLLNHLKKKCVLAAEWEAGPREFQEHEAKHTNRKQQERRIKKKRTRKRKESSRRRRWSDVAKMERQVTVMECWIGSP